MVLCSVYQYLFSQQGEGESLRLVVVHCNHKTRKETDHEESLVMQYLDRSVEYRGFRYRQKPSTESDLRTWRWGCFEKVVAEKQHVHPDHTVVVLTGHHLDDNIETSLLNLTR
jgi:tRNA(Ile)-lysidine synthase TilS/MesJ